MSLHGIFPYIAVGLIIFYMIRADLALSLFGYMAWTMLILSYVLPVLVIITEGVVTGRMGASYFLISLSIATACSACAGYHIAKWHKSWCPFDGGMLGIFASLFTAGPFLAIYFMP